MKAFYRDDAGDFEEVDDAGDAANSAHSALDKARDDADFDGEWCGETSAIAWGIAVQAAVEIDKGRKCDRCRETDDEDHDDEECGGPPEWVECVDYELRDTPDLAESLADILRTRPELWAELQAAMADGGTP